MMILLVACEKTIQFAPAEASAKLVVEASIETNQPPIVILSRSLGYFNQLTIDSLQNAFVHDAEIEISKGGRTHLLKEYEVPIGAGYYRYYYSVDSSSIATAIFGEEGGSYLLNIRVGGNSYSSSTSIPVLNKIIDSLWWKKAANHPDSNKVILMARTFDPPGFGDYVRYFTKTNNEPFFPGLNSVFDDQIIDGKTYEIQVDRGVNRNQEIDFEEYAFFNRGDTVTLKLCNIDKATFDFWRTLEFSYSSIGNPFSSPTKVLSNIDGGALGYFGGYAVQLIGVRIPE